MGNRISICQREIERISGKINLLNANYEAFKKAGLKKSPEARKCLDELNEATSLRNRLRDQDQADKLVMAQNLLLCLAGADFACEAANLFERRLKQLYGGVHESEQQLLHAIRTAASAFENIVTLIDRAHSDRLSLNFADMSDEISETLTKSNLQTAAEILQRHMEANRGRNLMLTRADIKNREKYRSTNK